MRKIPPYLLIISLYLSLLTNVSLSVSAFETSDAIQDAIDNLASNPTIQVTVKLDGQDIPKETEVVSYDGNDLILSYVFDICKKYPNVDPYLVEAIIWSESRFEPNARNGNCQGLMQVSRKWHVERMHKLGVTDLYDPYSNILVGVDILNDLLSYNDTELALMCYNMSHAKAKELYSNGTVTEYATNVITRAEEMKGKEIL